MCPKNNRRQQLRLVDWSATFQFMTSGDTMDNFAQLKVTIAARNTTRASQFLECLRII